jgi:putative DNA primase/helicase
VNTFEEFLRAAGLLPRTIAADGRWRRCATVDHPKKKNGAYKLAVDGQVGWCQDWATQSEPTTWRPDEVTTGAPLDLAAMAHRAAEARREQRGAIEGARRFYDGCAPLLGGHPYLEAHGLDMTGCRGLRIDKSGWMVVPAMRGAELLSVQRISIDGEKRFWPGAPVQGASYTIERPHASITVLCEGLATGLAIFAAAPLTRVVVAFHSGNLLRVAEGFPRRGMVCVAADNDHATAERIGKNPGLVAAQEVADVLGCGVVAPEGIQGTDWADYRQERLAERLENRGARERESDIRRAIDAEIAAAVTRGARFLRGTGAAS